MNSANKVALNTSILYIRMVLTVGISLYATRLVLNALGEVDYGIFNLVAGVIGMLAFLNYAMSTSTQRYLSFHHGRKDVPMQKRVFTNSILLHIILGMIVVLCLEIAGFFLFDDFLNIPLNRIAAAKTIYHFMSVTVFFTITSVPFTGTLNAYENMLWVAIVNTIEAFSKIAIAGVLLILDSDKLVAFGLLTACMSVVSFSLYAFYCFRKYEICSLENLWVADKELMKELTSFAGWNLFGSLCTIARAQGLAVLLNLFLGAVINAAYAIANQVATQLNFFSVTMLRAINPQIMKSEGANDRARMLRLSMMGSKFSFFLLAFIAIPCIFEMPAILTFWLKNVPDYTIVFCRLILIGSLLNQQTISLFSAIQAVGNVKRYQIVVGFILLCNIPLSYLLLHLKYPPHYILYGYIGIEMIATFFRVILIKRATGLSIKAYFERVLLKELVPMIVIVSVCFVITQFISWDFRFVLTFGFSISAFLLSIYLTGLCEDEKEMIHSAASKILGKFKK